MRQLPNPPPWWHRLPFGLIAAAVIVAIIPLIGGMVFVYIQWQHLASAYPIFTDTVLILVAALIVSAIGGYLTMGLLGAYNRWASRLAANADKVIEQTRAHVQVAPLASSFTYHTQTAAPEPLLALPEAVEPIEVIKPMAEWMPWIDEQPHTLLGGKTKAGKTWLATALLERRIDAGCDVFVIDPHSSDWMGLPTAGGSGIPERKEALKAVMNEYVRRMTVREAHKRQTNRELPHDYFDPMVVLIDEANAMLEELAAEWKTVLKQVASGSRKVGISLLMLAQSPLVEDIGLSGAMRENFSRIALDDRTVQAMIDSERNRERKAALQVAFKAMEFPAAAQIGATVWLLDRRGLVPGHTSSAARIWTGWDYNRRCAVSSVSPQTVPTEALPLQETLGNDVPEAVTTLGADSSIVPSVTISTAEVAQIATLLMTLPPSEAAKKLDGYHPRRYAEYRAKVDAVKSLIEGGRG
jgi:hypothetical protein